MQAMGLVETKGLVGLLAATDAMGKWLDNTRPLVFHIPEG